MKRLFLLTVVMLLCTFVTTFQTMGGCSWPLEYEFKGIYDGKSVKLPFLMGKNVESIVDENIRNNFKLSIALTSIKGQKDGHIIQQNPHPPYGNLPRPITSVKRGSSIWLIVNCNSMNLTGSDVTEVKKVIHNHNDNRSYTTIINQVRPDNPLGSVKFNYKKKIIEITSGDEIKNIGLYLSTILREKVDILSINLEGFYIPSEIKRLNVISRGVSHSYFQGSVNYSFNGEIIFGIEKKLRIDNQYNGRLVTKGNSENMVKENMYVGVTNDILLSLKRVIGEELETNQTELVKLDLADTLKKLSDLLNSMSQVDSSLSNEERLKIMKNIKLEK